MSLRDELSRLFEYDAWANSCWLPAARALQCEEVLLHIVDAQAIWFGRVEDREVARPVIENLALEIDRQPRFWQRLLIGADLDKTVEYTTFAGHRYANSLLEITRHVINHGTYHRGQLRGIAGERGVDFPETDYISFCRDRQ